MEGLETLLKGRNRALLMCFAMLWIIGFHFALYGNLLRFPAVEFLFGKGYLGVDIFFFLSAYGLCFSLHRNDLKTFYLHRLLKLYPLYLVFLLVLLVFFRPYPDVSWPKIVALQVTGAVSFTQMDIEWFIPALTILYITFPILAKIVGKVYRSGVWASSILIIALTFSSQFLSGFVFYLFPPRFTIIVVGILTYYAVKDRNQQYLMMIYCLCGLLSLMFIGRDKVNVSLTGALFVPIMLYLIGQMPQCLPKTRVLDFVGSHTLEIYLAQNLAFNQFMHRSSSLPFVKSTAVSFSIVIVASAVFIVVQHLFLKIHNRGKAIS